MLKGTIGCVRSLEQETVVQERGIVMPGSTGWLSQIYGQIFKVQDFRTGWLCQIFDLVFFMVFGVRCTVWGCICVGDCMGAILRIFVD